TLDGTGAPTPTNHKVTLNGGASLGHVVRRTDSITLPTVTAPPQPTGTRSVSLNNAGQSPGDFATLKNLTLNSNVGQIVVPPGAYGNFNANAGSGFTLGVAGATTPAVYDFQNLTLNSNSSFTVIGPVIVTVDGGFSTNADLGNADHPEWLKLRIAGGGLSINGNRSVYAHLEAPDGTLTLNGGAQFIGAVASDRLIINGNAVLRLVAPATANQPPTVALTAPADGTILVAPASFALTATATDADGAVAKVGFFQNSALLGEDYSAPFELVVSALSVGSYSFLARATDNTGLATDSAPITVTVAPPLTYTLPFLAGFEGAEGYALGALHGQQGWTASSLSIVTDTDSATGIRSALIPGNDPPLTLSRAFDPHPGQAVVFVDLTALPLAADSEAVSMRISTLGTAQVALVREDSVGRFTVLDGHGLGGGTWRKSFATIPVDTDGYAADWARLTLRLDYTAQEWDLYVGGVMMAAKLGFTQAASSGLGSFTLAGHTTAPTLLDDFLAGFDNPLFADTDRDGMDDAWEGVHGLNPAFNDRDGDPDSDGMPNVIEYLYGTDPHDGDSDDDVMTDGWEWRHGLDPRTAADAHTDLDDDGVNNLGEFLQGRNPTKGVVPDTT
ncbi:MAG: Ig-like domain-containing protein, partial [Pseudomonadota bacterium]